MKKKKIKCKKCDDLGYIMNPFVPAIPCDCKKKKKKFDCSICEDEGYYMNPFDQTIKCDCKKKKYKKADYRGFVLHIYELTEKYSQATISMSDLKELAKKYNTPIPKQYNK